MMPRSNTPDDFWARVRRGGPDECWPWIGPVTEKGYGKLSYGGKDKRAHQVAFFLKHGFYPPATLHTCDNPPCCNQTHLFAGTAGINNADRAAKGRSHRPKNELHPNCRVSDEQVAKMRKLHETTPNCSEIARQFGINRSTAWQIINGVRRQP